ncbi:hypothetical protein [Ferrimicrobium sp.]|uniref:hypothetical protein n=1 Tax=Ferrimicrobium sp. TaxID=2926050 RepID=UPI002635646C|nr:hypothetical protein [Ferrimicrobium sp.]
MSIIPDPNDVGLDSHNFSSSEERLTPALARYRPQIPEQYWDTVRPFVYDIMADVGPMLTDNQALKLASALVRFGVWVWQSSGRELRREVVFDDALIEQCFGALFACLTSNTLGTYRSRMRKVQKLLRKLQNGSHEVEHVAFQRAKALAPYTDKELVSLRSWAQGQKTHARRRDASVLLAVGAGAGLTTEDLLRLKTDDVSIDPDGVLVRVNGRRPREVPVLAEWEQLIVDAVNDIGPGLPLFGIGRTSYNNNAVSYLVARSSGKGLKPLLPRLRATWICYHLRCGTPILSLRKASGIDTLEGFDRYLPFLRDPEISEYRRAMRGVEGDQ